MTSNHPQEISAIRTAVPAGAPLEFTKLTNHRGSLTKGYNQGKDGKVVTTTI